MSFNYVHTKLFDHKKTSDGDGIVLAVLDSGVDPGVKGLHTTPNGKPKILDIVDCTGSGYVKTDQKVTPEFLKKADEWTTGAIEVPQGEETFSQFVRRDGCKVGKAFMCDMFCQERGQSEVMKGWKEFVSDKVVVIATAPITTTNNKGQNETHFESFIYITGFPQFTRVEEYKRNQKYYYIPFNGREVHYGVNYYQNGEITSLVFESNNHGTHVAGIIGANFPDNPERNGVAPGVQIVSLKIGDDRLEGLETSESIIRALNMVVEMDIHLVNMSYGEPVNDNSGEGSKIRSIIKTYCRKYNIIFVSSAGNAGPCMMTTGAPCAQLEELISVGAYADQDMRANMGNFHLGKDTCSNGAYPWSSRGPTASGGTGVDCVAPGAAVTTVASWSNNTLAYFNGTSMASPYVCGCLARVISSIPNRDEYFPYFYWVRRLLKNSCKKSEIEESCRLDDEDAYDVTRFGNGLINVDDLVGILDESYMRDDMQYGYEVKCCYEGNTMDGILLNNVSDDEKLNVMVSVKPYFMRNDTTNKDFAVVVKPNIPKSLQKIVKMGSVFHIDSGESVIPICINKKKITEKIFDVITFTNNSQGRKGIVEFDLQVSLMIPDKIIKHSSNFSETINVKGGQVHSILFTPTGDHVTIKITDLPKQGNTVVFALRQFLPQLDYSKQVVKKFIKHSPDTIELPVRPDMLTEFAIAPWWSAPSIEITYQISCHEGPKLITSCSKLGYDSGIFQSFLEPYQIPRAKIMKNTITSASVMLYPNYTNMSEYTGPHLVTRDSKEKLLELYNIYFISGARYKGKYSISFTGGNDIYESRHELEGFITVFHQQKPLRNMQFYSKDVDLSCVDVIVVKCISSDTKSLEKLKHKPVKLTKKITKKFSIHKSRSDAKSDKKCSITGEGSYFFTMPREELDDEMKDGFDQTVFEGSILGNPVSIMCGRKRSGDTTLCPDQNENERPYLIKEIYNYLDSITPMNYLEFSENPDVKGFLMDIMPSTDILCYEPKTYPLVMFLNALYTKDKTDIQKAKNTMERYSIDSNSYPYLYLQGLQEEKETPEQEQNRTKSFINALRNVIKEGIVEFNDFTEKDLYAMEYVYETDMDRKIYLELLLG